MLYKYRFIEVLLKITTTKSNEIDQEIALSNQLYPHISACLLEKLKIFLLINITSTIHKILCEKIINLLYIHVLHEIVQLKDESEQSTRTIVKWNIKIILYLINIQ